MKFKVHLVDDHDLFENEGLGTRKETITNLKPLLVDDLLLLANDEERILLAESIFEFKHFYRVDKAMEYYEEYGENFYPDLLIIDISFDSLEDVPGQPSLYTWGIDMGEYAHRKFPHIPRIFLSGNHTNPQVEKRLKEKNVTIDSLDLVRKSEPGHIKQRCAAMLRRRAKSLFDQLNENRRYLFWDRIGKGLDVRNNRSTKSITFDLRKMHLRNLLWGFGDINVLKKEEVNTIILDILQGLEKDIEFKGAEWQQGYVRKMLKEYQEEKIHYAERRKNIDIKSLNLLLEILQIRAHYNEEAEIPLYKNSIRLLSHTCSEKNADKDSIFEHKMIGRRVSTTFYLLFKDGDTTISLDVLSSLLSRGITYDDNNNAAINAGTVMGTNLGLKTSGTKVIASRKTMLLEEEEFYRSIGRYILQLRDFLDYYDRSAFLIHKNDFIDFGDFEDAVSFIKFNRTKQYPSLLNHIKETIDDHNPPLMPVIEYLLGNKLSLE